MALEELGFSGKYESKFLQFDKGEHKAPEYTKHNPNGRVPALVDHANNDFVVWESAAILLYLGEKYDSKHAISGATTEERANVNQWLAFQISGLGPSQGQVNWFAHLDPTKAEHGTNERALKRYTDETHRIYGVLEGHLKEGNKKYLVGDRLTVADIAYYPWMRIAGFASLDLTQYPSVKAWYDRIDERPATKKAYEAQAALLAKK